MMNTKAMNDEMLTKAAGGTGYDYPEDSLLLIRTESPNRAQLALKAKLNSAKQNPSVLFAGDSDSYLRPGSDSNTLI